MTNLFVELVVIGIGTVAWICLLILSIFDFGTLSFQLITPISAIYLIPILSIIYVLGIITDRFADILFMFFDKKIRKQIFCKGITYQETRCFLYTEGGSLKDLFEYGKSRIRICRGWAINSLLVLVFSNYFIANKVTDIYLVHKLHLFCTFFFLILFICCGYIWYELTITAYTILLKQYHMVGKNNKS